MTLGTRLFTLFKGELVGEDASGNRYYTERNPREGRQARRWVVYNGPPEASLVPADWHGWLHYRTDEPPPPGGRPKLAWQKEHLPNLTGTEMAYRPPGHTLARGRRDKATGDDEPWQPG